MTIVSRPSDVRKGIAKSVREIQRRFPDGAEKRKKKKKKKGKKKKK